MVTVIGGAYFETCREPFWDELYGSGFRSAVALSQSGTEVSFYTYADQDVKKRLEILTTHLGIQLHCLEITSSFHFDYLHPLNDPLVSPNAQENIADSISIETDEDIIYFGMLEGEALIKGRRVVYDPQSPGKPLSFWQNGSQAKELIVVLNYGEAALLAGSSELSIIIDHLINKEKAHLAIVKNGPHGAFLIHPDQTFNVIPSYRTERVWTIGSGDIFTTYFADGYLVKGLTPYESAIRASLSTAWYSENITLPVPDDLTGFQPKEFTNAGFINKTVYLAGPFFSMAQRWLITEFYETLIDFGFKVFSPLHDVGLGEADEVVEPDLVGLKSADIVLAVLDGLDSGTLFEVGYATSLGKKVIGFCQTETKESLTMILGSGGVVYNDFLTTVYQLTWHAHD